MYENIINKLMDTACTLKEIKEMKLSQVFTISAPINPYLPGFTHEANDWFSYGGSSSILENSDGCIEVLKEMNSKFLAVMHTFSSLYPDKIKLGSMIANVGGLDRLITLFESYHKITSQMIDHLQNKQSATPKRTIDLSKLNKMFEQFVATGIEIVKNNWKIPDEFLQKDTNSSSIINKEEFELMNQTLIPYIEQLSEPEINIFSDMNEIPSLDDLSDSIRKLII